MKQPRLTTLLAISMQAINGIQLLLSGFMNKENQLLASRGNDYVAHQWHYRSPCVVQPFRDNQCSSIRLILIYNKTYV
jgi:hypothetical protein